MRIHALTFILLLLSLTALTQKTFSGGIIGGPVLSQISGDGLGGWDKLGFAAGAWVNVPFNEKFSLDISMRYITKGSRTKRDTLSFNTFGYYLNYVDVPLLLRIEFPKASTKKLKYSAYVGPYAGVLLKQKIRFNGADLDINPPFNNYDFGVQFGASVWLGPKFFVQYLISTSALPTRPNPSITNKNSYYEKGNYNQVMHLLFGLRFGGGSSVEP